MRVLMVGAGGVGGYFGGRLAEKGEDVAFLVRRRRKEQLEEKGLVIYSVHGDFASRSGRSPPGRRRRPSI